MLLLIGADENHPNGAIPRKSIVRKSKKTYTFSQESEETVETIDDGLQQPVYRNGMYHLQPLSNTPTNSSTPRTNNQRTPLIQSSAESSRGNCNIQPFTQLTSQESPFGLNQHAMPPIQEISVANSTSQPSDPRRRPRSHHQPQQESCCVSFDNHPPPNYQS